MALIKHVKITLNKRKQCPVARLEAHYQICLFRIRCGEVPPTCSNSIQKNGSQTS